MKRLISPSEVRGRIKAPPSKSMMIRAVAASTLAGGESIVSNPSFCKDGLAAIEIAKKLGASVNVESELVFVKGTDGKLNVGDEVLNCYESGLCLRLFSPVVALTDKEITVTGKGTLLNRPVDFMRKSFEELGVSFIDNNGKPPIKIKGPLKGGEVYVDGSISSQFLTGLLFALPLIEKDSFIYVENLKSKPYIGMTLEVLSDFGVFVDNYNYERFIIKGGQKYRGDRYNVEGDWSGASFILVAGALAGYVEVENINMNSYQADRAIIDVLKKAGADVDTNEGKVKIKKNNLLPFEFDATECPDLFPPLVALASACNGVSEIKGVSRLVYKESNRATALKNEFAKVGIAIEIIDDIMKIKGGNVEGGRVFSHDDHRIAMACAVAGLVSVKGVEIENSEAVEKSYPNFFDDLKSLGAKIE